jgi:hypothetical protein
MSIQLIYHQDQDNVSPFDLSIARIVKGQDIKIICPYLGLDYLERIINQCKTWQLVTDVEAWISSHQGKTRNDIKQFIIDNLSSIHHYQDLHAKVIISDQQALIGSANFTKKGITGRVEMGVLLEDVEQVDELRQWFTDLWQQTDIIDLGELTQYCDNLSQISEPIESKITSKISSKGKQIKTKLISQTKSPVIVTNESDLNFHQRLVNRVSIFSDREYVNQFFDLANELLTFVELEESDPRLVMTIPKTWKNMAIIINHRYIVALSNTRNTIGKAIGFNLPAEFSQLPEIENQHIHLIERFNAFSGEKTEDTPYWMYFKEIPNHPNFKQEWKKAAMFEVGHGQRSPYRNRGNHNPKFYQAVMDLDYRKLVLDEV